VFGFAPNAGWLENPPQPSATPTSLFFCLPVGLGIPSVQERAGCPPTDVNGGIYGGKADKMGYVLLPLSCRSRAKASRPSA
jgi:hypothetical protein